MKESRAAGLPSAAGDGPFAVGPEVVAIDPKDHGVKGSDLLDEALSNQILNVVEQLPQDHVGLEPNPERTGSATNVKQPVLKPKLQLKKPHEVSLQNQDAQLFTKPQS